VRAFSRLFFAAALIPPLLGLPGCEEDLVADRAGGTVDVSGARGTRDEGAHHSQIGAIAQAPGAARRSARLTPEPERIGQDAPDVYLIVIDTLRRDSVSAYGYPRETTPSIDRLAGSGVLFENAFSTSSWTVPAMYSMITGLYPREHGVDKGAVGRGGVVGQPVLSEEAVTLTERLKRVGYRTRGVCTNHHLHRKFGFSQGFDEFVGKGFLKLPFPEMAVESFRDEDGSDGGAVNEAGPTFYWLHYFDPHFPYRDNQPWFTEWNESGYSGWEELTFDASRRIYRRRHHLSESDSIPLADVTRVHRRARTLAMSHPRDLLRVASRSGDEIERRYMSFLRTAYDTEVARVDRSLEKIFGKLGVGDEDLVIIVADHGEEFGDHGSIGHRWLSSLHDELVRVPLLLLLPGREHAGERVRAPVSIVDIAPTVADVLDLDVGRGECSGVSLLEAVEAPLDMGRVIHGELEEPAAVVKFRLEWPYKLIRDFGRGEASLYDMEADPGEVRDLSGRRPRLTAQMEERLGAWMERTAPRFGEISTVPLTAQELERLRAMGYVM